MWKNSGVVIFVVLSIVAVCLADEPEDHGGSEKRMHHLKDMIHDHFHGHHDIHSHKPQHDIHLHKPHHDIHLHKPHPHHELLHHKLFHHKLPHVHKRSPTEEEVLEAQLENLKGQEPDPMDDVEGPVNEMPSFADGDYYDEVQQNPKPFIDVWSKNQRSSLYFGEPRGFNMEKRHINNHDDMDHDSSHHKLDSGSQHHHDMNHDNSHHKLETGSKHDHGMEHDNSHHKVESSSQHHHEFSMSHHTHETEHHHHHHQPSHFNPNLPNPHANEPHYHHHEQPSHFGHEIPHFQPIQSPVHGSGLNFESSHALKGIHGGGLVIQKHLKINKFRASSEEDNENDDQGNAATGEFDHVDENGVFGRKPVNA